MPAIETRKLTHRYGRAEALVDVDLDVPEGALYALLGPNGAGKTTLLRLLAGLQRPTAGTIRVLGRERVSMTSADRTRIAYVAEGLPLPGAMTLAQLEAYVAPLYPTWDLALAHELRRRFRLDPRRRIRTFSRGEHMKAALLLGLAPRPRLLLLDEPFTGMDAVVKDDLIGGLLESAGQEGWTVLISSHDLAELEPLADWVGFLESGRLRLSQPMDSLGDRFRYVEAVVERGSADVSLPLPPGVLDAERAGPRVRLLVERQNGALDPAAARDWFPRTAHVTERPASLREVFVALARHPAMDLEPEEVRR